MERMLTALLAVGLGLLSSGAVLAQDCSDEILAAHRICTDPAAAADIGGPGWLSCYGSCLIAAETQGISITDSDTGQITQFAGAYFLAGAGITRDLTFLPLLAPDGRLVLLDPVTHAPAAELTLAGAVEGDPARQPRFTDEARLSADGQRLFIPSPDGPGFAVWRISGDGLTPLSPADPVMVISASGRYGLSVAPDGDGTYRLQDYGRSLSFATDLRFEIDTPFFDLDEKYLLRRHMFMSGPRLSIYDLNDLTLVSNIAWSEDAGLNLRIGKGKTGIVLEDLGPPAQ